jgi:2-C-methyl-D-erythritol 4-phosphate cytidylyltransferase
MDSEMRKYAVIVAGGIGTRMGADKPKQFLLLKEKPILLHTLEQFLKAYNDLEIILVLPTAFFEIGMNMLPSLNYRERVQIVAGGPTRFDSVKNGLSVIQSKRNSYLCTMQLDVWFL